jgi:hypothetical protein
MSPPLPHPAPPLPAQEPTTRVLPCADTFSNARSPFPLADSVGSHEAGAASVVNAAANNGLIYSREAPERRNAGGQAQHLSAPVEAEAA